MEWPTEPNSRLQPLPHSYCNLWGPLPLLYGDLWERLQPRISLRVRATREIFRPEFPRHLVGTSASAHVSPLLIRYFGLAPGGEP